MKQKKNFILLILNCEKYLHKRNCQKETWLKNLPEWLDYYHIIGCESLQNDYLFNNENKILYVKTADDYLSLPKKTIKSLEAVEAEFDFDYIFKTDDDQFMSNPFLFFKTLKNKLIANEQIHYGGKNIIIHTEHFSSYNKIHKELPDNIVVKKTRYCNGRFYFLSKYAVYCVLTKKKDIEKEFFEDYAIGYHLDDIYKTNMLNIDSDQFFKDYSI